MKKLLAFACLFLCIAANGATFTPFVAGNILTAAQLNAAFNTTIPSNCLGSSFALTYQNPGGNWGCNGTINAVTLNGNTFANPGPIGSVTPSTGAFTNLTANGTLTFANGSITLPYLATQSANTVVANTTAGTASPTAVSVPSCSTSASAINYTSGTGFGCNSAVNAAQLGGATFASPTAIGSTTPSTGAFTTLSSTGNFTPSQTNGIVGTTTNNNANAGSVGEYVTANTSNTAMSNAVALNATSVSLTAGDWDVTGVCLFTPQPTTVTSTWTCGVSTTSATRPTYDKEWALVIPSGQTQAGQQIGPPTVRVSLASTTTVFLVALSNFSTSTQTVSGTIRARRVR